VFCRVWVWRMMLPVDDRPSFLTLLAHDLLGLFYNNFLPGGVGGDVVRTGALVQGGQRIEQAANSVLMARLLGLWSIVLLACVTTPLYAWVIGWQTAFPLMVTVLSAFIIAVLGTAILFGAPMTILVNHLPARWSTWHRQLRAYREKRSLLIAALGLSFLIQILAVTTNTLVARALGLSISFPALLLSIPLVNLVVLLPISIGGFGVREGVYYYLLEFFGATAGEAVLLSLTVYFVMALVSAVGAAVTQIWVPKRVEEESCAS
ncbi:MAG: YbhN family protein, partial [Anaerolineales bacterium]